MVQPQTLRDRTPDEFDTALEHAKAGQQAGFEYLYRTLAPSIKGFARSKMVRDCDEIVSDTMVGVARGLHAFQGGEREFRAWAFTIAYRRIVDEQRRGFRRVRTTSIEGVEPADPSDAVEESALRELGEGPVFEALARLKSDQRDVLVLRIVADLPIEQVAEILGKKPSAVKMIQQRALARLREEFGKSVSFPGQSSEGRGI